jgi:hypothetical protein
MDFRDGWSYKTIQTLLAKMSLANLSMSATAAAIAPMVYDAMSTNIMPELSYFDGIICCICVAVGVVCLGAMSTIDLLSTRDNENKQQIKLLKMLIEQQYQKMELMEKDLAEQKQNAKMLYNLMNHSNNDSEQRLRAHTKSITDHSNHLMECRSAIYAQTQVLNNHNEALMNVIRHLHEQNKIINHTHAEVENHKILIQGQMDTLDCLSEDLEHAVTEFDRLSECMDQSVAEFEMKLEDAIDHFQSANDKFADQLEEHENQLYSVEDELFERVKEMGDRVEEVDRAVLAVEKSTEKVELDLAALGGKVEEMEKDNENDLVILGSGYNNKPLSSTSIHKNATNFTHDCDQVLFLDQILKLKNLERFDFTMIRDRNIAMNKRGVPTLIVNPDAANAAYVSKLIIQNADLKTLVQHFQKCGTQMFWNGAPLNFEQ